MITSKNLQKAGFVPGERNDAKLPVSRSVMKLVFNQLKNTFGTSDGWICCLPDFKSNYGIWVDNITGKTMVSGLDNKKTEHNSVQEAMAWCQLDFESKVDNLFEDSRFKRWKEKDNINGRISNETAYEIWSALDECDK